jgi:hypothetical protein
MVPTGRVEVVDEAEWLTCTEPGEMLRFHGQSPRLFSRIGCLLAAAVCRRVWWAIDLLTGRDLANPTS